MKKFLLIICILLSLLIASAVFILPYGLGFIAQNKYTQILNAFNKSSVVQVTLLNYQRGWFNSKATVKIVLPSKSTNIASQTWMTLQQEIAHGPVFSFTSSKGEKSILLGQGLITSHIESAFGTVNMVNWIKWDGAFWGIVRAPVLHFSNIPNKQEIIISGLSGFFKLPANLKRFFANFNVPEILIKTDKLEQRIEQTHIRYNLQKSMSDLFLGERSFTARSIVWNTPLYPSKLKFEDLSIHANSAEKNQRMRDEIDLSLKKIAVNNASYGPQILSLTLDQVDTPTLLTLKKELNKLHGNAYVPEQMLAKYQQLLMTLLSKGIEVQLKKFQIVTPWGNPSLVADIRLPAQPSVSGDIKSLLHASNFKAEANVPATFLIRALENFYANKSNQPDKSVMSIAAQQQVNEWVKDKWLLPKDNGYQITALYQNQSLMINGLPSNLP